MARVNVDYIPLVKETEEDLRRGVNSSFQKANEILRLMSIGINTVEFGNGTTTENVYCEYLAVQFSTAGTELTGTHTLGRTPTTIVGRKLNMAGDIYFSKAATTTAIYLKSDTDSLSGTLIIA
jgi:hypothetical protein